MPNDGLPTTVIRGLNGGQAYFAAFDQMFHVAMDGMIRCVESCAEI